MTDEDDVFDVVVIGAGPVGEIVASRVVHGGLSVAIVEERLVGGECAFYACIPSKALLRPVGLAAEVSHTPGLQPGAPIDVAQVLARRDEVIHDGDDGAYVQWVQDIPATFVRGRGRLAGPRRVEVTTMDGGTRTLRAEHAVVIATGSSPAIPEVPGLREAQPWTNREATAVKEVPRRLVVLGGGAVGCEMALALHALGAEETTMVVRDHRLLARAEPYAGEMVTKSFQERGIDVRLGRLPTRVERPVPDGPVTVHIDDGSRIEADEILIGLGRQLNVGDIGLETIELEADGRIAVDESMRATDVPDGWLYAIGDVNGRNLLTHMGKYQSRVAGDVIAARAQGRPDDLPAHRGTADNIGAPQVIFTDPQVCWVGRTEERAREEGYNVRVVQIDMGSVDGAVVHARPYIGKAKFVVDQDRQVLLGVSFVGPGVVDLLHSATIAVTAEVPLERLWHAVPPFPTVSEVWLKFLEEYGI
jgi:dihydrolipoamide dehydrogenase